jgi:hydrogenase expression/formation protein HypE
MTGKFTRDSLERLVFSRTGAPNDALLQGPAYGTDAAAIQLEDTTLVVSTDPISLAAKRIGQLGVAVASNDVAASGATPEWLTSTILLPSPDEDLLDTITAQLDAEAERLDMTIVGGHTETVAGLDRPLVSLTCMGQTERFVPTDGAQAGDRILLTKGAAIEGTAVLASDFGDELDLPAAVLNRAEGFFDEVSVIPDAAHLAPVASAMHDPTEGGILGGLVEMAVASGAVLDIDAKAIPLREETRRICDAMGVDPLRILGSGALLATVPPEGVDDAVANLREAGIEVAVVGRIEAGEPGVRIDGERYADPVTDEIYALWE